MSERRTYKAKVKFTFKFFRRTWDLERYFCDREQYPNLRRSLRIWSMRVPVPNFDQVPYRLESIYISEEDVKDCLRNLKIKKPRLSQSTFTERRCYRSCPNVFRYFQSITPTGLFPLRQENCQRFANPQERRKVFTQ